MKAESEKRLKKQKILADSVEEQKAEIEELREELEELRSLKAQAAEAQARQLVRYYVVWWSASTLLRADK